METYLFSQYNSKVPGLHIETATIHEDFSAHQHDFSELVVILSGRAVHSIENRNYRISSGDVYVLTGNTVHEFSNVEDLEICNIMFDPLLPLNINPGLASISGYQALFAIEPLLRPEGMEQHRFSLSPIQLSCVREMILLLYVEYQHLDSRKERKELILNLFGSLCYYLSIKKEENIGLYGNNTTARAGKAAAFIHSHFSETLTIDEIAGSGIFLSGISAESSRRHMDSLPGTISEMSG